MDVAPYRCVTVLSSTSTSTGSGQPEAGAAADPGVPARHPIGLLDLPQLPRDQILTLMSPRDAAALSVACRGTCALPGVHERILAGLPDSSAASKFTLRHHSLRSALTQVEMPWAAGAQAVVWPFLREARNLQTLQVDRFLPVDAASVRQFGQNKPSLRSVALGIRDHKQEPQRLVDLLSGLPETTKRLSICFPTMLFDYCGAMWFSSSTWDPWCGLGPGLANALPSQLQDLQLGFCPFYVVLPLPPKLQNLDICMRSDEFFDDDSLEALGDSLSHLTGHLRCLRLRLHDGYKFIESDPDTARHLLRCLPDSLEQLEVTADVLSPVDPVYTAEVGRRLSKLRKLNVAFIANEEGLASALSLCQHGARPIRWLGLDIDCHALPTAPTLEVPSLRHLSLRVTNKLESLVQRENKLIEGIEHLSSVAPKEIQSMQVVFAWRYSLSPSPAWQELCESMEVRLRERLPQTCSYVVREGLA